MFNIKKDYLNFSKSAGFGDSASKLISKPNNRLISPVVLEEREMNVVAYDVFSRLLYDRIIFIGSEIDEDVANIVNSQLLYLDSLERREIKIYINSPGGSVTDGLAIYDVMNFVQSKVSTTVMGLAASMGAVLLSSGEKGLRYALPNSDIMIHEPLTGSNSYTRCGEFLVEAEQIKKCRDKLFHILAENTGKSVEEIAEAVKFNKWFSADEAKEYGLVDRVIKTLKSDDE